MQKMKNAKKTMVYLDEPEHRALKLISEQTGIPMAEQIRRAVSVYLKDQPKPSVARKQAIRHPVEHHSEFSPKPVSSRKAVRR